MSESITNTTKKIHKEEKMGKILIGSLLGILLMAAGAFAANGDLIVDGNLGVGTTSPGTPLEVKAANTQNARFSSGSANVFFSIGNADSGVNHYMYFALGSDVTDELIIYNPSTTSTKGLAVRNTGGNWNRISMFHNDTYGCIQTSGTTPLVLQSTGNNVGIGTTSPAYLLDVNGQARINGIVYGSSRASKDNIVDLKSSEATEALKGLNPVTFSYKKDETERHVGFIAEDVPDLVAKNGRTGIDPMDIVAVLTKVVQEQQKTIEEQQKAYADQRKTMDGLNEKLIMLEHMVNDITGRNMVSSATTH